MFYCHIEEPIQPNEFVFTFDDEGDFVEMGSQALIAKDNHSFPPLNRYTFFFDTEDSTKVVANTDQLIKSIARQFNQVAKHWLATWSIPENAIETSRSVIKRRCAELEEQYSQDNWFIQRLGSLWVTAKDFDKQHNFGFSINDLQRTKWQRLLFTTGTLPYLPATTKELILTTIRKFADSGIFAPSVSFLSWMFANNISIVYPLSNTVERIVILFVTPQTLDIEKLKSEGINIDTVDDLEAQKHWSSI